MTTTKKVKISNPNDVLTTIPFLIGFRPWDSVVVLSPSVQPTVARIDLPTTDQGVAEALGVLSRAWPITTPAILVTYSTDDHASDTVVAALREHFTVLTHVRAYDGMFRADNGPVEPFVPNDEIAAGFVHDGVFPLENRDATLLPDKASEPLLKVLDTYEVPNFTPEEQQAEEAWWLGRLRTYEPLTDQELARLVTSLDVIGNRLRDVIHTTMDRTVEQQVFWRDAAERVGNGSTGVAITYAFASWLRGDGVAAWAGIDQVLACEADDRDRAMASLLSTALQHALDPRSYAVATLDEVNAEWS